MGLIVGVDQNTLSVLDDVGAEIGTDGRFSWNIGALIEVGLTETLSLSLAPAYQHGGAKLLLAEATGGENPDYDSRLSFVEVPLFLRFNLPGRIKTYLAIGPTLAVPLDSKLEADISSIHMEGDAAEIIGGLNLGLAAAAGIRHQVGPRAVFLEARYTHGMSDLLTSGTVEFKADALRMTSDLPDLGEMFTRSLRIQVGLTFPLLGS
jgi:hypothetical protein